MNAHFLGPLGSLVGMGVSRLQRENEMLNAKSRLKKVKVNAFNGPANMPGQPAGKGKSAINQRPDKIQPLNLRGSQARMQQPEAELELRGNKRKRKGKVSVESQTPTETTTTTTTSTTPTSSTTATSTSNPTTTNKVQQKQNQLSSQFTPDKVIDTVANAIPPSGNNNTNTSSYTMAQRNRKENTGYSSPLDLTTAMGKAKHTDFNKPSNEEAIFVVNKQPDAVKFSIPIPSTVHLNVNEPTDLSDPDYNARLFLNISSFSEAIDKCYDSATLKSLNPEYKGALSDIFYRMNKDVLSNARSTVSSSWEETKFINVMAAISWAIELITTYDSITAYDPILKDIYNRNDALEEYQKLFYSSDLLTARYNLAKKLKSCWFPPEFSQMIRWFFQNYRCSSLSQSAYYRFVPDGSFILSNPTGSVTTVGSVAYLIDQFNSAASDLKSADVQNISSLLVRLYPQGIIRSIPFACQDAVFDTAHFEIYTNSPIFYKTPQDTVDTNWACYPLSYGSTGNPGSTNNDFPYYMASNPGTDDGFAYVMQNVASTVGSTGYDITNNSSTVVNMYNEGIAIFNPYNMRASTITSATQTIMNSNKWIFDQTAAKFWPRCGVISQAISGNDATSVYAYTTTTATTWKTVPFTRPNTMHQRVYFNNRRGPLLNRRILVEKLFSLKG